MHRSPRFLPILPMVFATLLAACGSGEDIQGDITSGLWRGDGGPESFYWELWREGDGYGGVVHTLREGRKESELPVARVTWNPPRLEMEMSATGAVYAGRVDFKEGRIRGGLRYGGGKGPDMELRRVEASQVPGLRARPSGEIYYYSQPSKTDDGWETARCESLGIPVESVESLVRDIIAGEGGVIHSLLLVQGGRLVLEEYFHGFGPGTLHRLASVTKSVSSLLVGQAIDAGRIENVEAPLEDFFEDYPTGSDWRKQNLRQVLTMSMGLDWDENGGPHGTGPQHFQQVFERRIIHEPGTHWAYHSANVNLLAGVIRSATGLHADEFAEQRLFEPLGILDYDWSGRASGGYRLMDGSLHLRPRDMAKLGMLLRDEGRWRGEQVVSERWILESTREQIATDGAESYGYLWWIGELPTHPEATRAVFANGHGSQFIIWFPERDLIAVTTGGNEDNGKHFAIGVLLGKYILPQL